MSPEKWAVGKEGQSVRVAGKVALIPCEEKNNSLIFIAYKSEETLVFILEQRKKRKLESN